MDGRTASHRLMGNITMPTPDGELIAALAVQTWCDLSLPPMRRLLGDVVTEAARVFLVGATGIGKTLFAYAIAAALAAGRQFLHWSCDGPVARADHRRRDVGADDQEARAIDTATSEPMCRPATC